MMLAKREREKRERERERGGSSPDGVYVVYLLVSHLKRNDNTLSTQDHTHICQETKRFPQFQQARVVFQVLFMFLIPQLPQLPPSLNKPSLHMAPSDCR